MLVFIFIKEILVLSFGTPDMNSGSVSELNWLKCDIFSLIQTTTVLDALIKSKYAPCSWTLLRIDATMPNASPCHVGIYIYIYIYPHTQILFVYDYHLHRKCRPLCHTNIHKKMCNNLIDPFTCIDPDLKTIYPGLMSLYINGYIFVSKKKKKKGYIFIIIVHFF